MKFIQIFLVGFLFLSSLLAEDVKVVTVPLNADPSTYFSYGMTNGSTNVTLNGTFTGTLNITNNGNGALWTNLTTWVCRSNDFQVYQDATITNGWIYDGAPHTWDVSGIVTGPAKQVRIHMYANGPVGTTLAIFSASNASSQARGVISVHTAGVNDWATFPVDVPANKKLYYYGSGTPNIWYITITHFGY